jgi:ankyrin repeat protein
MLNHPSADRLHLDYYPGDSESTVREIIMQTYPSLQPLLPAPLLESLDSSEGDIKLLAALQRDKYYIFIVNLYSENLKPSYNEPYHSSVLEIACQMKNRKTFVELLLDNGADPNSMNRVTGMPLLHATARIRNFEVLQLLLEKDGTDMS